MPTESKVPVASTATAVDTVNVCLYKGPSQSSPWPSNRVEVGGNGKLGDDTDTEQIKSLGHNRDLHTEHSSPQRFIARPSKHGLSVEEGDAPFTTAEGDHEEDGSHQKGIKRGRTRTKKESKRGAPVSRKRQRKVTDESTDEEDEGGAPKIPWRQQNKEVCASTGCTNKANRAGGLCHKHFASSSAKTKKVKKKSPPVAPGVKPLFKVGSKVHAAYWSDESRKSKNPSFANPDNAGDLKASSKDGETENKSTKDGDGALPEKLSPQSTVEGIPLPPQGVFAEGLSSGVERTCNYEGCTVNVSEGERCSRHKVCSYEGCKSLVRKLGLCGKHGGRPLCSYDGCIHLARTKGLCGKHHGGWKKCSVDGCTSYAQTGGVCCKHGAKKCSVDGCTSNAQNRGVCFKHGANRKKCSVDGCTSNVQNRGVCFKHGAKRKKCSVDGCTNNIQKGGLCCKHGAKKCSVDGCTSNAQNRGVCCWHGPNRMKCSVDGCTSNAQTGGVCCWHGSKKK